MLNFLRQQFFTVYMKLVILRSYSNPTLFYQKPSAIKKERKNLTYPISHQTVPMNLYKLYVLKA